MIIWRGFGILVVVVTALMVALLQLGANALLGGNAYEQYTRWLFPLGLLLAASILWPLGRYLNGRGARVLVDRATGQEVTLRPNHSLFFIKMEYWALLLVLGAAVSLGYGLLAR